MSRKCCVYGCKSNYKLTEVRYGVFCFPRDDIATGMDKKISKCKFQSN